LQIHIRAFAQFGELFGHEMTIEVSEASTIPDALALLCDGEGEKINALFAENGSVHDYLILVRNRVRVERDEIATLTLATGDELALLPPVAGG
jgi:molybdopterin synthase sulfur carrier subunit